MSQYKLPQHKDPTINTAFNFANMMFDTINAKLSKVGGGFIPSSNKTRSPGASGGSSSTGGVLGSVFISYDRNTGELVVEEK